MCQVSEMEHSMVNWAVQASLVAQRKRICLQCRRSPAVQETRVQSLGREDPLEKEMATHSSVLAWKAPQTEEPAGLAPMGLQRVRRD